MKLLRILRYPALFLCCYLVSLAVVGLVIRKGSATPIWMPKDASLYYLLLTLLTLLLGVIWFLLSLSDHSLFTRRRFRLILDTGSRYIAFSDMALAFWSVLMGLVLFGLFVPWFPLSSFPALLFGTGAMLSILYDSLVLHQLFVLVVTYRFVRECYRRGNRIGIGEVMPSYPQKEMPKSKKPEPESPEDEFLDPETQAFMEQETLTDNVKRRR